MSQVHFDHRPSGSSDSDSSSEDQNPAPDPYLLELMLAQILLDDEGQAPVKYLSPEERYHTAERDEDQSPEKRIAYLERPSHALRHSEWRQMVVWERRMLRSRMDVDTDNEEVGHVEGLGETESGDAAEALVGGDTRIGDVQHEDKQERKLDQVLLDAFRAGQWFERHHQRFQQSKIQAVTLEGGSSKDSPSEPTPEISKPAGLEVEEAGHASDDGRVVLTQSPTLSSATTAESRHGYTQGILRRQFGRFRGQRAQTLRRQAHRLSYSSTEKVAEGMNLHGNTTSSRTENDAAGGLKVNGASGSNDATWMKRSWLWVRRSKRKMTSRDLVALHRRDALSRGRNWLVGCYGA